MAPPPEAPSPFRHADPDATTAVLTAAGFAQVGFTPLDAPMYLGRDAGEGFPVLSELLGWMVRELEPAERDGALAAMRSLLQAHETDEGVALGCAAWLITATRP
jgi:hypothetical protein